MKNNFPRAHVSVPFSMLRDQYLPFVLSNKISVEIVLDAQTLEDFPREDFKRIGPVLAKAGLSCSIHAPFMDLSLGAFDPRVRQVTVERMEQVIELLPLFPLSWVVCHAGYEARHYRHEQGRWQAHMVQSLSRLLPRLESNKIFLMVENVFENDTAQLTALFQSLASPWLRFCLDVGHHHLYSRTDVKVWLDDLGPFLGMVHLHDNHGLLDDHLALGQGSINFLRFFALLKEKGLNPSVTLEPHQEEGVLQSLEFLACHWPWR